MPGGRQRVTQFPADLSVKIVESRRCVQNVHPPDENRADGRSQRKEPLPGGAGSLSLRAAGGCFKPLQGRVGIVC